jgi:hypothetical protein
MSEWVEKKMSSVENKSIGIFTSRAIILKMGKSLIVIYPFFVLDFPS